MRGTPLNNEIVRLIKEPLVHFFVFVGTIFVFYGFFGKQNAEEQERVITNSAGEIGWLADTWKKCWNQSPTPKLLGKDGFGI